MLSFAAICLVLVSAMHSWLGGRDLIDPICRLPDVPVILGSRRNAVLTLKFGWHFLSLIWLVLAALLLRLEMSAAGFPQLFLLTLAAQFGVCGATALIASRGRHLSWVVFFHLALALAAAGWGLT
ncbi:hypothetical protein [Dinoroseobacter sp. S124A]|uniref:hypothetical protein n=1 Tax=Dinoroseobacter sp. S124A TaxID=3415128 RepID=UPI003C7B11CD